MLFALNTSSKARKPKLNTYKHTSFFHSGLFCFCNIAKQFCLYLYCLYIANDKQMSLYDHTYKTDIKFIFNE